MANEGTIQKVALTGFEVGITGTGNYINGLELAKVSGTITYEVEVDTAETAPLTFRGGAALPKVGMTYAERGVPFYGAKYVDLKTTRAGRRNRNFLWIYKYTIGGSPATAAQEQNGTILTISASTEAEDYATACDLDGLWNVNSLGEWYQEPLSVKYGILTFTFVRREYENPWFKAMDYWETINDAQTWSVFPQAALKVASIIPTMTQTEQEVYWDVNYQIKYRALGWLLKKANSGFYARSPLYPYPYRILNADGSPTENPSLLDANGAVLAPGVAPVYRTFRLNQYANFDNLNLPSPFDFESNNN